jgi:phage terminase Nu1 subunit (DNA packaging protein)
MRVMSVSEYATARGVSQQRISALKSAGRLALTPDGKIDADQSDRNLAQTASRGRGGIPAMDATDDPEVRQRILAARAKREHHEANLAALRERKESGELVALDRVQKAAIDAGALIRSALEQLPGKLGASLAAESDPTACRALLRVEIDAALADLIAHLAALGDTVTPHHGEKTS